VFFLFVINWLPTLGLQPLGLDPKLSAKYKAQQYQLFSDRTKPSQRLQALFVGGNFKKT